ncbi:HD-GYP domain-containing protein [Clostridia bacterium OttesenSCG-928-F22]|nr:HD-GYP domain-containing protein [Clostridia bacterium OttesenSCG-928-F22]
MKLLPLDEVKKGMVLKESVYSSLDSIVPIVAKDTIITPRILGKLREQGIREVKVATAGEEGHEPPRFYVPKPKPVIQEKLRKEAIDSLEEFFLMAGEKEGTSKEPTQVIKHMENVVEQLVDSITQDKDALVNISDLKSYDEYTYHHSLGVAVLCIAMGQTIGFSRAEMYELGKCAIMHDIGKTAIPIEIINKPGRLDVKEFDTIKRHPAEGYYYLTDRNVTNEIISQGVLFHHEKVDGTGYPFGLKGAEIPLLSRIISVADVYDALTSNRPYRDPMQPFEAVEYIMAGIGSAFDYDTVAAFIKKMELYPVGSFVRLSNDEIGCIVKNENPLRPVVQLVQTGEILDLYRDRNCLSLTVKKIIPAEEFGL